MKNNKKIQNAWCMYDWANSAYNLTITTAIFPSYYAAIMPERPNKVNFLGFEFYSSALYSFSLAVVFLLAAILSPILTPIADNTGKKKFFMQLFCYLGSLGCVYLYFFHKDAGVLSQFTLTTSVLAFITAGLGYSGSIVFYNSFLPEIATEDQYDRLSAKGFAMGYIGSVLLLVFNITMLTMPDLYFNLSGKVNELMSTGLNETVAMEQAKSYYAGLASRISFLSVGVWWFAFAQYSFYYLPSNVYKKESKGNWLWSGFKELSQVLSEVRKEKYLKIFLPGFFFYNLGVQTVMYMAVIFAEGELNLKMSELIIVILIIQLLAIVGANLSAKLSDKIGNISTLRYINVVWVLVCVAAYFVKTDIQFYMLAIVVGFIMGGIQSMSRSTYAKLIPPQTTDHASYFSFYDIAEKLSCVFGLFLFGVLEEITGSMRPSTLTLGIIFIIGITLLSFIPSLKSYSGQSELRLDPSGKNA
ncbi:MAG: MFS transporter [Sporocytophaga sp.]|uniref:MFS transporter n=1 Tax=Sporocytophaga sp. TaxID=2231183 RepID=UPI001B234211|nr:MFS transporter [Sporocytophaga sp.]MBO9701175.1 MFS transporter [Sporocytophaga sp.]